KIVLATGRQGGGAWHVPDFVTNSLPPGRYSHACAAVDYASKAGQRLAILGGGAAAFANAEMALAAGVAEVHLFLRGPALQRAELSRLM
ncbi:monooxygenase, partial [Staphylococcus aureus]